MPNWTKEQMQAINEENTNILVSAGAGSGKTAVLSERVLRKVKEGIDIDRILILTFTKAAAYEMMVRIRKKLVEANLLDQVDLIDKAYITTFDSFSLSIVKKYHDRLNINKDIAIIDNNSINIVKVEILDKLFEEYYKSNNSLFDKLISDFCLRDDKELKEYILKLNNNLDLKYDKKEYLTNYLNNFYSKEYINKTIKEYESMLLEKINNIKEDINNLSIILDGEYISKLEDNLSLLLNSKDYISIKNNSNISLPTIPRNSSALASKVKEDIKKNIDSIKELTNLHIEIIIDILLKLDEKIMGYKVKANAYEFVDISKLAISLVKDNRDIREELTNYFNEIMIDEYQDTSDLQEEFIGLIANNNTYMVGDIKQSIYRFRNANPNIFKTKYIEYANNNGGLKIDLNKNFRSREEVLDNINRIFNSVMSLSYGGADYSKSHKMIFGNKTYIEKGSTEQNYNLEIKNYTKEKDSIYYRYSNDELEAFIIAKDIKEKIESKYQVFDKDSLEFHNINYSDFVILLDRSTKFNLYKKIFEYLNIPLTLLKDIDISGYDEVYLIKNILKLIECIKEDRKDNSFKYAYTSIARSYLFRLSDEEIYFNIVNNNYNDLILEKINNIINDIDLLDLKSLIKRVVEEFNFYEKMFNVSDISDRITVLEYFDSLEDTLTSLNYDYHMFINYLDDIVNDKSKKIEIPVSVVSENSVRIMTIHKSKGLEYPICYYAGVGASFNIRDLSDKVMFDNKYGIIVPSFKEGYIDTFIKALVKKKYYEEEISEKIRLFYVALTRCKEKMIVVADIKDDDVVELTDAFKENYRSFLDILNSVRDKIDDYVTIVNLDDINITKDYLSKDIVKELNVSDSNKLEVKEFNIENEELEDSHFSKTISKLITKEEKSNLEFGTLIHELFEIVDFKNLDLDTLDVDDKYKKYIINFLSQDLLSNIKEANILKEYEFYTKDKHGIIDLLLEYSDHIDIIDYKLKHIDDPLYKEQLSGYKEYIESKTNKPVILYLYSILDNKFNKI